MRVETETFKVRFGSDVTYDYKYTANGPLLYKPDKDEMGFSIWFPLEFLNQNNLDYSIRWVYSEGVPTKLFS